MIWSKPHWGFYSEQTDAAAILCYKFKRLRRYISNWKKTLKPDKDFLASYKFTLAFMDWIEEGRPLSELEILLRDMVKRKTEAIIHSIALAARQRGKNDWCVLGDEDTRFYHPDHPLTYEKNNIKNIEIDGVPN